MTSRNNGNSYVFYTKNGLKVEIIEIEIQNLSEDQLNGYFTIRNQIFYETYPNEDPLPDRDIILNQLINPHPHYTIFRWVVLHENNVIGFCHLYYVNEKSPSHATMGHIANVNISINQQFRRQGIATQLLKILTERGMKLKKTIVQTDVYLDNAVSFCEEVLHVKPAKTGNENRLYFKHVDWDLMYNWVTEGQKRAKGVVLHIYPKIPEEIIEEYCEVYNETSNQEPSDQLEELYIETPESRRITETRLDEKNQVLITIITKESDNKISSLTEIFYDKKENYQGSQWLTGVRSQYRGRGLGKWIKAAMLLYFKENYPSIEYVRAGNADLNAPMRSINDRMGFKRIFKRYDYNIKIEDLIEI